MGQVFQFPGNHINQNDEALVRFADVCERETDPVFKLTALCEMLILALQNGRIKPEAFFFMYRTGSTCPYISCEFPPYELEETIELIVAKEMSPFTGPDDCA